MILESTSVNTYINELQPENIKFISLYLATPEVTTHLSHTIRNYTSISSIEYIHRNNQIAVIAKPLVMDITCRTQTVTGTTSQAPPSCPILTSAEFGNLPAVRLSSAACIVFHLSVQHYVQHLKESPPQGACVSTDGASEKWRSNGWLLKTDLNPETPEMSGGSPVERPSLNTEWSYWSPPALILRAPIYTYVCM